MRRGPAVRLALGVALLGSPWVGCRTPLLDEATTTRVGPAAEAPWPMEGRDPQGSRRAIHPGPERPGRRWHSESFQQNPTGGMDPVVGTDGTVFGWDGSMLRAFDADALEVRWTRPLAMRGRRGPMLGTGGLVHVVVEVEGAGRILALDPGSGEERWHFSDCDADLGLVGPDGAVYGSCADRLFALRPSDGLPLWTAPAARGYHVWRLAPSGTLLVQDGYDYFAVAPESGALLGGPLGPYCLSFSGDGRLHCIARESFPGDAYRLYEQDLQDGRIRWSYRREGYFGGGWAEANDGRMVVATGGELYALDAAGTRRDLATLDAGRSVKLDPALDGDGVLYLVIQDGSDGASEIAAYAGAAQRRWSVRVDEGGRYVSSPVVVGLRGSLYFTTCNIEGPIVACRLEGIGPA